MTVELRSITIDCADHYALMQFWSGVTGWPQDPDNPNDPGDPESLLVAPDRRLQLLFIPVPEAKTVKNRVHLDVVPVEGSRDEEVERLLGLGATIVGDHRRPDGSGWVTLADPEGNEFCVERSATERAATPG
jgi:predicted enzyme related to lactoylglutathione lyase